MTAVVGFPSSAGTAGASLTGTLGKSTVKVVLEDSVTGRFVVPDVAAGTQALTVDFGANLRGTASISVTVAPAISNPKQVVTTTSTTLTLRVDSVLAATRSLPVDSGGLSPADAAYLQARSASLKSILSTATDAELRQIALWIQANPTVFAAPPSSSDQSIDLQLGQFSSSDVSARVNQFIGNYVTRKVALVATIGGCAAGLAATGPLALFAGAACGAAIALQATQLRNLVAQDLGAILAIPQSFFVDAGPASLQENVTRVLDRGEEVRGPALLTAEPGTSYRLRYQVQLRGFTVGDRGLLGELFSAIDEVTQRIQSVLSFLGGWTAPNLYPSATAASGRLPAAASDVTVSVPGCTLVPEAQGALLTCSQISETDLIVPGSFTYRNAYGSTATSFPVTVRRTWATVGVPTHFVTGSGRDGTLNGSRAAYCLITMTIPVTGNTPVLFTGWRGVWQPGGTVDASTTNILVDPLRFSGIRWLNNTPIYYMYRDTPPSSYSVDYVVSYTIPALNRSGTVNVRFNCTP